MAWFSRGKGGPDRCLVHLGLTKTGSTAIQYWLSTNRRALRRRDVHYDPFGTGRTSDAYQSIGQQFGLNIMVLSWHDTLMPRENGRAKHRIDTLAQQKDAAGQFADRLDAAIGACRGGTFVLSTESLAYMLTTPEMVASFHDWISQRVGQVDYLAYVRDPIDWVTSAYSQHLRGGGTLTLAEFAGRRSRIDSFAKLSRWKDGIGAAPLDVRLYERAALKDGDIIADFADKLGVSTGGLRTAPKVNSAFTAEVARLMRRINEGRSEMSEDQLRKVEARLEHLKSDAANGTKIALHPKQARRIAEMNHETNERLRRMFFSDREVLFRKSAAILAMDDTRAEQT